MNAKRMSPVCGHHQKTAFVPKRRTEMIADIKGTLNGNVASTFVYAKATRLISQAPDQEMRFQDTAMNRVSANRESIDRAISLEPCTAANATAVIRVINSASAAPLMSVGSNVFLITDVQDTACAGQI